MEKFDGHKQHKASLIKIISALRIFETANSDKY